ncbi:MAG: EF2563 family selenium-dependent molybdenum hydroxylase system protein [Caldilineaceae bacterium]|nr:EF2563 family selenium-dependent molybdenum hydroxylase system protein [Caldilineaceae bacterium]
MAGLFPLVVIKGAGDLASGVAIRLHRAGFPVVMTEIALPLAVRRTVAFAQAVFDGVCMVEEVRGRLCAGPDAAAITRDGDIAVVVDPAATLVQQLHPMVVVDAIMAKRNMGTQRSDARLVVALGPGFTAGVDCHAVVETNRGHNLGRVIWQGCAEADTGTPGELPGVGKRATRVLRAPAPGYVRGAYAIGDRVAEGAVVATIQTTAGPDSLAIANIVAPFDGLLRGLIHPLVPVTRDMKIGDLDPRADPTYCHTVSDKSLAIGGGVLEAVLQAMNLNWNVGELA